MRLRKVLFVTFLALAVPVGTASLAYACTALATLSITSGSTAPGQTVTGTGKGFNGGLHGADPATASRTPVVMRLDTRSGPILGTFTPTDASGNLVFSFAAPNVSVGQHVLIGVQNDPGTGTPYYGTPARQSFTVAAPAARTEGARADGVPAPVTAGEQTSTAPAAAGASTTPVAPTAAAATATANAATRTAGAAASGAKASVAAPPAAQAGPVAASSGAPAASSSGLQPTVAGGIDGGSATPPSAGAALSAAPATTTVTPDLASSTSPDGRSVAPGLLLMLVGLGIGLAATARLASGRLPQLRRTAAA